MQASHDNLGDTPNNPVMIELAVHADTQKYLVGTRSPGEVETLTIGPFCASESDCFLVLLRQRSDITNAFDVKNGVSVECFKVEVSVLVRLQSEALTSCHSSAVNDAIATHFKNIAERRDVTDVQKTEASTPPPPLPPLPSLRHSPDLRFLFVLAKASYLLIDVKLPFPKRCSAESAAAFCFYAQIFGFLFRSLRSVQKVHAQRSAWRSDVVLVAREAQLRLSVCLAGCHQQDKKREEGSEGLFAIRVWARRKRCGEQRARSEMAQRLAVEAVHERQTGEERRADDVPVDGQEDDESGGRLHDITQWIVEDPYASRCSGDGLRLSTLSLCETSDVDEGDPSPNPEGCVPPCASGKHQRKGFDIWPPCGEWEKNSSAPYCKRCVEQGVSTAQAAFSVSPFSTSHHCRSCGLRVCGSCLSPTLCHDDSFATLQHPEKKDLITDGRRLCKYCMEKYERVCRSSYLGVLMIIGRLNLYDIALLRGAPFWRDAGDMVLGEYRTVLHDCQRSIGDAKLRFPLGRLLMNSISLILSGSTKYSGSTDEEATTTPSSTLYLHREPALLLLRYLSENGLWRTNQFQKLLASVASIASSEQFTTCRTGFANVHRGAAIDEHHQHHRHLSSSLSHFRLFCSQSCVVMHPVHFTIKTLEYLVPGMQSLEVQRVMVSLIHTCIRTYGSAASIPHVSPTTLQHKRQKQQRQEPYHETECDRKDEEIDDSLPSLPTRPSVELDFLTASMLHLFYQQHFNGNVAVAQHVFGNLLIPMALHYRPSSVMIAISLGLHRSEAAPIGTFRPYMGSLSNTLDGEWWGSLSALLSFLLGVREATSMTSPLSMVAAYTAWIDEYCAHTHRVEVTVIADNGSSQQLEFVDLPSPMPYPFRPDITLRSVIRCTKDTTVKHSSCGVMWLRFSTAAVRDMTPYLRLEEGRLKELEWQFLFKADNVENDWIMCLCVRMFHRILTPYLTQPNHASHSTMETDGGQPLNLPSYDVFPVGTHTGIVERVRGCTAAHLKNNFATSISRLGPQGHFMFQQSAKIFILLNYLFDIGDRHSGNVMLCENGALVHIDFGYVLREKTLVERLSGTSIRIDDELLEPIRSSPYITVSGEDAESAFYASTADLYLRIHPHADLFCQLWRCRIPQELLSFHRDGWSRATTAEPSVAGTSTSLLPLAPYERQLADIFNQLFDRRTDPSFLRQQFISTMKGSVNACRLKDTTHTVSLKLQEVSSNVKGAFFKLNPWSKG